MMKKIGVEQSLSNVTSALQEKGYEVITLKNEHDAKGCDCCIVTGQDTNVMGIQNTVTPASIISAEGMTANEICNEVEERLNRQH
ncbi:YkuS family protein [Metabacillus fastidiosus]|uniref:UPF0180 protein P9271_20915 n=1 Tax=Metabacillus fastidiosus TaxID=1458 RepID=A0ABU6P353_9BACI|nr:YkuS family protein [Metabacillus fastidiosus]MED4403776.1 YkuS family protein [Metabacillus fastidiosus]MED4452555.1 YkuS family protein [Metabacillus fastidiosus]MED4463514.1 YkuS family protein [Metabacillus fastidiosus]